METTGQIETPRAVGSKELLDNWPRHNGRLLCAPAHPMPKDALGFWCHTNVSEVGDQENGWPGGDIVKMRCADCGAEWKMELPQ